MKEFFSSPEFIAYMTALVLAAVGSFIGVFQTIKAKQSVKKANAYAEEAKAKLEADKLELERALINGSYVICPKCGEHIILKDTKVYLKEKQ